MASPPHHRWGKQYRRNKHFAHIADLPRWDNWNAYGCDVSEDLILNTAKRMASIGLRDVGYYYVILDDCWSDGRYDNGSLRPDFTKFPNGMGYVADQVHSMGLGWGMYSSAGKYTCAQYARCQAVLVIHAKCLISGHGYTSRKDCVYQRFGSTVFERAELRS